MVNYLIYLILYFMMTSYFIQNDFELESRMVEFVFSPNMNFDNEGLVQIDEIEQE